MNTLTEKVTEHATQAITHNSKQDGNESPVFMTGEGIVCFRPWLAEARPDARTKKPKNFEVAVAFPEGCSALKDIIARVVAFRKDKFGDQRKIVMPFKKGDDYVETFLSDTELTDEEIAEFEERSGWMRGHIFFNAKTKFDLNEDPEKPQLIDSLLRPQDPKKVFGGAVVRIQIAPYPYENSGKKGVSLGLRAVQVLKDAPKWEGGASNSASAFTATAEPEEGDAAGAFGSSEEEAPAKKAPAKKAPAKKAPAKKEVEKEVEEEVDSEPIGDDDIFGG